MGYGRAAIPALAGGLLVTALLWWAGASDEVLRLQGSTRVFGPEGVGDLQRWLAPWSYDTAEWVRVRVEPPGGGTGDGGRYLSLYSTAMQIRFFAVFAFFVPGALLLVRRLPPVNGRVPAALLALWAWGVVAGTLAVAVSAPWMVAAAGRGSYRFLPALSGLMSAGRQILVPAALLAAVVTVLVARATAQGAGALPRREAPARAARAAATVGAAVVALSLVVLSYDRVAAEIQGVTVSGGLLSEPGDLLRQWLLLGGWSGPAGTSYGHWLLYRAADVLLLAVVWCGLRWLPGLLTRVSVHAMAACGVCVTVIGLLVSQLLHAVVEMTGSYGLAYGPLRVFANLGNGVPAALVWGTLAGCAAVVTYRLCGGGRTHTPGTDTPGTDTTGTQAPDVPPPPPYPPAAAPEPTAT
ncbi:hypothetical protein ACIRJR_31390 [Streptomyces sp. NPDC102402]|uniref:hypothetical protein n=1 Tax=Streptomyces sp. NPDC102402 TaxID=3366169 RepID=UPI0037FD9BD6